MPKAVAAPNITQTSLMAVSCNCHVRVRTRSKQTSPCLPLHCTCSWNGTASGILCTKVCLICCSLLSSATHCRVEIVLLLLLHCFNASEETHILYATYTVVLPCLPVTQQVY